MKKGNLTPVGVIPEGSGLLGPGCVQHPADEGLHVVNLAVPPCEEAAPDLLLHQSPGSKKHMGGGKRAVTPAPPEPVSLLHLDLSQDTPKPREKNLLLAFSGYSSHCSSLFKHRATWKICPHIFLKHLIRALKTFVFAAISDCILIQVTMQYIFFISD